MVPWQPTFEQTRVVALNVPFTIFTSCSPLTCRFGLMMVRASLTTVPWHCEHRMLWEMCVRWSPDMLVPSSTLWQAPHASAPGVTHEAVPVLPRPLPWQYRFEHVVVPTVYTAAG